MNKPKPLTNKNETLPPPPLDRVIEEGVSHFCKYCNSTMSRKGLFGKRTCDNTQCPIHDVMDNHWTSENPLMIEPPRIKEFCLMNELLNDAEKYAGNGDSLSCTRILEALSESIDNYINKPVK